MWADLGLVRDQFQHAVAPVEYVGGWSLLAAIGTAFVVLLGDTFAFRAHARGEALVPGAVLFVFVAAVGADRHRVALTLALVAAGFLAAALLRARFAQAPRTVLGRARSPLSIALPAVAVAGTLVVLGAWAVGPRLPGADAEPLVETHNDGGGVTEVLSPLVDIRVPPRQPGGDRAVRRPGHRAGVLAGRAACPSSTAAVGPARPRRSTTSTASSPTPRRARPSNDQEITITGLGGKLVPGAPPSRSPPPARVCAGTPRRRPSCASTGTSSRATASRSSRRCRASRADALRAATSASPPDPIYLELPTDFPASVARARRSR